MDTFEGNDPTMDDNRVLRESAAEWQEYGTFLYPAMVINDRTFRGRLNPENVYEAVCASFRHEPKECRAWQQQEGIPIPKGQSTGINTKTLFILILVLIFVNISIILLYRRYLQNELKKDMNMQVSSAVSQYIALSKIPELESINNTSINED